MAHLPLSLERFATLQAEIDAGLARDELLRREQLSLETWLAAQRAWFELMANELDRDRLDISQRYASLYLAAKPELGGAPPLDKTMQSAAEPKKKAKLDETVTALALNVRDVLPFGFDGNKPVEPPPPMHTDDEDDEGLGSTMYAASGSVRPATPFEKRPEPPPRRRTPPPPPRRAAPPPPPPEDVTALVSDDTASLDDTATLPTQNVNETLPFIKDAALPFAEAKAQPPKEPKDKPSIPEALPFRPAAAAAPPPPTVDEPDLSGATHYAGTADFAETLPFDKKGGAAPGVAVDGWTVEQYASLCVELERAPKDRVLARYRIDEAKYQRLEQQWTEKFATSTRLARLFLKARARYLEWLEQKK